MGASTGMRRLGELGGLVAVHAENDTLIHDLVDAAAKDGRRDVTAYLNPTLLLRT
jgi:dihydroorotase-like cyclic amidohydrolase